MSAKRWSFVLVVVAGLVGCAGTAMAQMSMYNPTPTSNISGYTGSEMRSIYREGVGDNFSTDRIIKNNLQASQARVPYVGQSTGAGALFNLGLSPGLSSKPFSAVRPTPTVSPWMNMFRDDLSGDGDLNYQTLVRPQLEQQQINRQLERQNIELGRRVQAMSAQSAYTPQGSDQMYPTGHPTVFMNYGHYYPVSRGRR